MKINSDFKDLLRDLNAAGVRYLIVGGYAVMVYTEPRFTKDLDIWVETSEENAVKVFQALARFGAPLEGCTPADFLTEGIVFQIGVAPVRIDILTAITEVNFNDAWNDRVRSVFLGSSAWFISREHLLRNKRARWPSNCATAFTLSKGRAARPGRKARPFLLCHFGQEVFL